MPRGERIGDAYVRIHADGKGMKSDIREDLKDVSGSFEEYGRKHSEAYEEAYNKESAKQREKTNRELLEGFDKTVAKMAARVDRLTIPLERSLRKRMTDAFGGRLGEIMGENLVKDIAKGFRTLDETSLFGDLERQVQRATVQIEKMSEETARKIAEDRDREFEATHERLASEAVEWERMLDTAHRLNLEFDRKLSEDRDRMFEAQHNRLAAEANEWQRMLDAAYRMNVEFDRKLSEDRDKAWEIHIAQLRRSADAHKILRNEVFLTSGSFRELYRQARQERGAFDFSGGLRNSRNDFLHFFGGLTNMVASGIRGFVNLGKFGVEAFKALNTSSRVAAEGMQEFTDAMPDPESGQKLLASLAAGAVNLQGVIASLLVTLAAATVAGGVLAAAISGIVAILVALSSTVIMGAIASVAALAGALGVLAIGAGVVVAAFMSMSDEMKERLKTAVEPLTEAFKDLGESAADVLFRDVEKQIRRVTPAIEALEPIVDGVARGFRRAINQITTDLEDATKSGALDRFMAPFERQLPRLTAKLARSFSNITVGFAGIFRAMLPMLNRFLTWVEDITAEFAEWANSAKGQRELRDFFKEAGDAAETLGDFLAAITEALAEIIAQSSDEGMQIFESMTNAVQDLIEWLSSPEGQAAMDDWLQWGITLADKIGDVVVGIQEMWAALDNPVTRALVMSLFDGIIIAMVVITNQVNAWRIVFSGIADLAMRIWDLLRSLAVPLPSPFKFAEEAGRAFLGTISTLITRISSVPDVGNIFSAVAGYASGFLGTIGSIVTRITGMPSVRNLFSSVIERAQNFLGDVGRIATAITNLPFAPGNIFSAIIGAAQTVLSYVNSIAEAIRNLPGLPSIPTGGGIPFIPGVATGGMFGNITNGPLLRWVGEDGPEAIVPMDRPLSQVDPSVRWLSAIAQGKAAPAHVTGGAGKSVTIPEINVYPRVEDPRAITQELLNHIAGAGY